MNCHVLVCQHQTFYSSIKHQYQSLADFSFKLFSSLKFSTICNSKPHIQVSPLNHDNLNKRSHSELWQLRKLTDLLRAQPWTSTYIRIFFAGRSCDDNLDCLMKMGFEWTQIEAPSPYWNGWTWKLLRVGEAGEKSFVVNTHLGDSMRTRILTWRHTNHHHFVVTPVSARCISLQFGSDLFLHFYTM